MRTRSFATLISFLLALFALFASSSPSYAAVGWWNAGGTSGMTSVDVGNNGKNRSFAVSSTGAIYSVIADAAYGSGATLKILSGSVWTTVGTPGFSPGAIYAPIIKIAPDGTPYVSYIDAANGDKPVVRRLVGSSWEDVGSASLAGMVGRRDDTGRDFALAPDGTPYLSINDTQGNSGNVGKLAVLRYQSGVWTPIGGVYNAAGGAGTTYINDGASFWNILAFTSDGTPYVAFEDYGDNAVHGGHIRVRKYVSGAWTTVGPSNISAGSYNDHMAFTIAADDTPYIVYGEMGQSSNPPVVKRWNGSSWVQVGGYVVPGGVLNLGILVDTDGKIYVRLCDGGNGYKQYVYVYDGSNWVNTVPGGQFPGNVAGRAIMLKDPTTGIIYADATANISGFSY